MRRLQPRSPYEKLGGYVHLPRLIDKAKLHRKGLLDGYNYKTVGFDKHLLSFLKLDGDAFEEAVHRLENDGDRIVREAIASLFEVGIDPMVVIRWKDIFERLENAIDSTERAADILEGIVIKNA